MLPVPPNPPKKTGAAGVKFSSKLKGIVETNTSLGPVLATRAVPTAAVTTTGPVTTVESTAMPRHGLFRALDSATNKAAEKVAEIKRKGPIPPPSVAAVAAVATETPAKRRGPPPPPPPSRAPAKPTKETDCKSAEGTPAPIATGLQPYSVPFEKSIKQTHYKIKKTDNKRIQFKVSNRFSFSHFIPTMYEKFKIKGIPKSDPEACKKMTFQENKYQQFIREYFRLDSPTRGALVYHGLGSGKTCSAIAAAESLFSESGRKIIVMTPVSLRANFLREIKFCGFKVYRTQNHWVPLSLYKDEDEEIPDWSIYCFAKSVLNISPGYLSTLKASKSKAKMIWVPDMTEGKQPNFDSMTTLQKSQITAQINDMINNSIDFIGYNGLTEKKLKHIAKNDPTYFHNKTIIIDEVHNLTSLMRGRLTKYLEEKEPAPGGQTKAAASSVFFDKLSVEPWKLVEGIDRKYDRAYLIYRLLSEARHSKIIALSGTPIVNYPEELGILGNVLHGNFHCASFSVASTDKDTIESILVKQPYVDFYSVTSVGAATNIFITRLELGFRKAFDADGNYTGVVYEGPIVPNPDYIPGAENPDIPKTIPTPDIKAIAERIRKVLPIQGEKITYSALPLFPVSKAKFNDLFVNTERIRMKNSLVFLKRMSGLISYYKGGRKDYMPSINKDVIVETSMSDHMLAAYIEARRKERDIDEVTKGAKKQEEAVAAQTVQSSSINWGAITGVPSDSQAKDTAASSYRFRSRALCNFAFPRDIPRPFPRDKGEAEAAAGVDVPVYGDEDDTIPATVTVGPGAETESEPTEPVPEGSNSDPMDATTMAEAVQEDAAAVAEVVAEEAAENPAVMTLRKEADAAFRAAEKDGGVTGTIEESERAAFAALPYEDRINYTLEKLRAQMKNLFLMDPDAAPTAQLAYYSPKFAHMYDNIKNAPGSSLVYSQFKTLEGLGIFSIALEANGYARVRLVRKDNAKVGFSPETLESLQKNPIQPRYTIFSGDPQDAEFRKELVDIFNMNIEEPIYSEIRQQLIDAGLYDVEKKVGNQEGEFCRIFMITGAGSEGISLKNVRAVHLMEPHWNKVRMDQVKGRAVRICSHKDMPVEKRNVDIYTYLSVLTKDQLARSEEIRALDDGMTSDQYIFEVAKRKSKLNADFLETIQMGAVDCELNKIENGMYRCFERDASVDNFLYDPRLEYDVAYTQQYFRQEDKITTEIQRRIIKRVDNDIISQIDMDSLEVAYANERMRGILNEDYFLIYTEMIDEAGQPYFGIFSDDELSHPLPFDRERELGRMGVDKTGKFTVEFDTPPEGYVPAAVESEESPIVQPMEDAVNEVEGEDEMPALEVVGADTD